MCKIDRHKYNGIYLSDGDLVGGPVEDWRVVVDVLNLDRDGAHRLKRGTALVAGLGS